MGTLETIARHLTKMLQPLEAKLQQDIRPLFAELGIEFPASIEADAALKTALQNTVTKTKSAVQTLAGLETAIQNKNEVEIIAKAVTLISDIAAIISSFDAIATRMEAMKNAFPGIASSAISDFSSKLPENLFNYLFVHYLATFRFIPEALEFVGLFQRIEKKVVSHNPADDFSFVQSKLQFGNIGKIFTKPSDHFKTLYDWGDAAFDGKKLLKRLDEILSVAQLPVFYDEIAQKLDIGLGEIRPKTDISPKGIVVKLKNPLENGAQSFSGRYWKTDINFTSKLPTDTEIIIQPNGNVTVIPPAGGAAINGKMAITWSAQHHPVSNTDPFIVLGQTGGSRIQVGTFEIKKVVELVWNGTQAQGKFKIESSLAQAKVILNFSGGDGFLSKILPAENMEASFDSTVGISSDKGVYFSGSSALEIRLPTHIEVFGIDLQAIILALKPKQDGSIQIGIGGDIKTTLGPLTAVVQNIGAKAIFTFPSKGGNLGALNIAIGFQPPNGVGLSIDAGGLKGGGFLYFDFDKGEYGGALELEFNSLFSLKAIAIINTKMPDGSPGFSLLILITAEFTPIQLGFGFTLNGVGGLLALNRTVRVSALQEGIKTNAIKSILFPENIVANISRIISDIKQFFPQQPDHFIIGPMAKIGWGTPSLITVELGIILDLPDPIIVIIGVLKTSLPSEDAPLLRLQVNFIGILDFKEGYIFFRADLFDSRLLAFTLTGSMALLISWGTQKTFALSVGGFHPDFRDIPSVAALPNGFRNMDRISISLLSGDNPRLRVENYFAVTSNTVQFGAKAELYAEAAGFNVYGFMGFDVLFQFDPFRFIIQFYAGLALRAGTSVIMGIDVRGKLSGPTPWDVQGDASITILFFEISVGFHVTWGDPPPSVSTATEDLRELLKRDFADVSNWRAELPPNNHLHVSIREIKVPDNTIIVHPSGVLTFSERTLPLKFDIQKFGTKKPKDEKRFEFKNAKIVGVTDIPLDSSTDYNTIVESFAANQFEDLSDDQKLSRKSFEDRKSGFRLKGTTDVRTGKPIVKDVDYELIYLKKKENLRFFGGIFKFGLSIYNRLIGGSAVRQSVLSKQNTRISLNAPPEIVLEKPKYAVANVSDLKLHSLDLLHDSEADAYQAYNRLVRDKPELMGEIQVVHQFELQH